MSLGGNVMPRRLIREKKQPWTCKCEQKQPAAIKRCLTCLAVRP